MCLNENQPTLTINPLCITYESSHKLEQMKSDLNKYKKERLNSINEGVNNSNMQFKETFYSAVEDLIIDIIYISSLKKRNEKINQVYKWYKDKLTHFEALAGMKSNAYDNQLDLNEIPPDITDTASLANNHRTLDNNIADPKKILEGFLVKKPFKPKSRLQFNNSLFDFSSTLGSTKAFTRYSLQQQPHGQENQKYADKIGQASHLNNHAQSNNEEPRTYYSLKRQCDIITGKHKSLSNKRHLEEVQAMINEFGFIRSSFKKDQMKRQEIKKLKGSYSNINTIRGNKISKKDKINPESNYCFIKLDVNQNKLFSNARTIKRGLNYKANQKAKRIHLSLIGNQAKRAVSQINFSEQTKDNKVTNDMIATGISINPIFRERFINQTLLDVPRTSLAKNTALMQYAPLSGYDVKHLESQSMERTGEEVFPEFISSLECAKKQFNCSSSYLDLRKSMEKYKQYDLVILNKMLQSKKRELNKSALLCTFLSPKEDQCIMGFLPKTGQGLLSSIKPK